jgi:6-phosphofructokinase 1
MGRDAGWLTASAALPVISGGRAPDLIYLPERVFELEKFIESIKAALEKHPDVLVVISEGIRFADGTYVGASKSTVDAFGHVQLSGAGKALEWIVKERIGCKVRSIELNLPQRAAGHLLSRTDIMESIGVGMGAVNVAVRGGRTGVMMTIDRIEGDDYSSSVGCADISSIANAVRGVPDEYITESADGITDAGIAYLAPLIEGEINVVYEKGMPKHITI